MKTDADLIKRLREVLRPKGDAPLVKLHLTNKFFSKDFVDNCIDCVEAAEYKIALGVPLNHLEKLALYVLCDSAYVNLNEVQK